VPSRGICKTPIHPASAPQDAAQCVRIFPRPRCPVHARTCGVVEHQADFDQAAKVAVLLVQVHDRFDRVVDLFGNCKRQRWSSRVALQLGHAHAISATRSGERRRMHMYTRMHAYTHMCMYMPKYSYVCVSRVSMHIHFHARTHTHTHTHTHTAHKDLLALSRPPSPGREETMTR